MLHVIRSHSAVQMSAAMSSAGDAGQNREAQARPSTTK